ncbi:hypothetical protein [Arthrobacter sp. NA-172]|uniref:hypothetical protein n=1 Tax=Arthrobacter sp. NA-172 TaxID=3367524 RepID=UPI0037549419
MTAAKYTAFVEGKNHDAVYYERVITGNPDLAAAGVRVIRSEEVADDDVGTGGKSAVLALHDFFETSGDLTLHTNESLKHLVFLVDRDYDEFNLGLRVNEHIVYTHGTDVEAEIYRQGDLVRSLGTVFSLTADEAEGIAARIGNFAYELALQWRQWITLCIAAGPLGSRCAVRPSRPSAINIDTYGEFDWGRYRDHHQMLISAAQIEDPESKFREVSTLVDRFYEDGAYFRLIKGKLFPGFVVHLVALAFPVSEREKKHKGSQLTLAMLDSARFEQQSDYYLGRLVNLDTIALELHKLPGGQGAI